MTPNCGLWPDFFIVGAAKAGTTTLFQYLNDHPEVGMAQLKEPRFFAFRESLPDPEDPVLRDSVTDMERYLQLFPRGPGIRVRGEASPIYLASRHAVRAIAAQIPSAKLIAILRDPASRAFSHFLMSQRQGYEPETSFSKALDARSVRLGSWTRFRPYLHYSRYGEGLFTIREHFDKDQLLVLFTENLHVDPHGTLQKVAEFLEIGPFYVKCPRINNTGYSIRSTAVARVLSNRTAASLAKAVFPQRMISPAQKLVQRLNTFERRMTLSERRKVVACLNDDIFLCENILGVDLSAWRKI